MDKLNEDTLKEIKIRKLSDDTIVAICAAFIALCALGISVWQGIETRRHNKLSVSPYLSIRVVISKQAPYMGIQIDNNGVGPAVIKKCIVFIDGEPTQVDSYESWEKAGNAARIFDKKVSFLTLPQGTVLKEGQSIPFIAYPKENQTEESIKIFQERLSHLRVKIIYESIYKEEFEVTNLER